MTYLIFTTLMWAFSFSLIGVYLSNQVDPWFCVWARLLLASLLFSPSLLQSLRTKSITDPQKLRLMFIGGTQLGVMYFCLYHAFSYLFVAEVLLFTIVTPLYIYLIDACMRRKFQGEHLLCALLAVGGAYILRFVPVHSNFLIGFSLIQGSNLAFAFGQVAYKHSLERSLHTVPRTQVFSWFYLGALLLSTCTWVGFGDLSKLPETSTQISVILYLGLCASGLGFFLWNTGATLVNTGQLAVMNNMLIPAGILVNATLWNRDLDSVPFIIGTAILMIALIWNQYNNDKQNQEHTRLPITKTSS